MKYPMNNTLMRLDILDILLANDFILQCRYGSQMPEFIVYLMTSLENIETICTTYIFLLCIS